MIAAGRGGYTTAVVDVYGASCWNTGGLTVLRGQGQVNIWRIDMEREIHKRQVAWIRAERINDRVLDRRHSDGRMGVGDGHVPFLSLVPVCERGSHR